ncbi:MAG: thiol:disulfide interchange protein, partial [Caulobacterales bacterium]|nr:thiol:disulfide interchange protein [Caulobacterales bacterium]
MPLARALSAIAGLIALAAPAAGEIVRTDNVEAELVADRASVAAGETVHVALRKRIRDHWHTYWRNAGDAGEPTAITWTLPGGFSAGDIQWPLPKVITLEEVITNYGYEGDLLLPVAITAPDDLPAGESVTIEAYATWLVCEDICIPEEARLSLTLPAADGPSATDPAWGAAIAETLADIPRPAGFSAALSRAEDALRLTVADPALASAIAEGALRDPHFFPFEGDAIDHNAAQPATFGAQGLALDLKPAFGLRDQLRPTAGVLAFESRRDGGWTRMGVEIAAAPGAALDIGAAVAGTPPRGGQSGFFSGGGGIAGYLIGAFIG